MLFFLGEGKSMLVKTNALIFFGILIAVSSSIAAAIKVPLETLEFTIICDALSDDNLLVKIPKDSQQPVLLSSKDHSFVARVLQIAAEDNRPDIVLRVLRDFDFKFELGVVEHVLIYSAVYAWDKGLDYLLEGMREFLIVVGAKGHPLDPDQAT
jgi:hypothetical protein